ncbi:MAG: Rieske 2Fe-2S domain-containing protein [Silvibacterium sp.]|nr:Rieske 2Fe-2S domain-containing protein [Silvibacterium sp.]MBV8436747.1 Rieske 2Fe-2S domain-containing protein [Silvibacterium sp.]
MTNLVKEEEKITQDDPRAVSRRWMLLKLGVFINAVVGVAVAVPVVRYLLGPVKRKGAYNSWISLGSVDQFPMGETRLATYENPDHDPWDGDTAKIPCWVRHVDPTTFQVFAINCAHLGCPVRWFPQSGLFMCPCHGGVYYADGSRASGPPERGMFEYKYRIVGNELQISAGEMPTLSTEAKNVFRVLNNEKGCGPCAG